jgi:hypothetical protein
MNIKALINSTSSGSGEYDCFTDFIANAMKLKVALECPI